MDTVLDVEAPIVLFLSIPLPISFSCPSCVYCIVLLCKMLEGVSFTKEDFYIHQKILFYSFAKILSLQFYLLHDTHYRHPIAY